MANLTPTQRSIIRRSLQIARQRGAGPRKTKALLEAEGVESNFRNLNYGDRDGRGVLQQRPSQGWGSPAQVTNVDYAVSKFLDAAAKADTGKGSAAELAQRVQRSAFPGRYATLAGLADQLMGGTPATGGGSGSRAAPAAAAPVAGSARGKVIASWLLSNQDPLALASRLQALPARTAAPATPKASSASSASSGGMPAGIVKFDGKPVAAWVARELSWARAHGWTGTVTSGYRTDAQQTAIYKSGVRPAAVPKSMGGSGSNHEGSVFPLGAVDVTQAPQLAQILQRRPGSKLKWAGAKDPVHFSHPHSGGY